MKFTGLLLKESLADQSVLKLIKITKQETWNVKNAADYQSKVWTAISFKGEGKTDKIAKKFSEAMNPRWYLNISTDKEEIVVFPNKVFKYLKGDKEAREKAVEYGRFLNIPESQLDL